MKDILTSILAYIAVVSGVIGILCVIVAISTAIWYYLVNFVLSVFSTGYEITWMQAFAVSLVVAAVRNILSRSKE